MSGQRLIGKMGLEIIIWMSHVESGSSKQIDNERYLSTN